MAAFAHCGQGSPSNCPASADRITAKIGWISVALNSLSCEQFGQFPNMIGRSRFHCESSEVNSPPFSASAPRLVIFKQGSKHNEASTTVGTVANRTCRPVAQ